MFERHSLLIIYISRIYSALISIAFIPFIFDFIGAEGFGLVGFFVVLQACLHILDVGIGGVVTRQVLLCSDDYDSYKGFLRAYKKILLFFCIIALIISTIGVWQSSNITELWLDSSLDDELVKQCIIIMFLTFSSRYVQSPMRSVLLGKERHVLISIIDILTATISSPLAVVVLFLTSGNVLYYFYVQLLASLIRVAIFIVYSHKELNMTYVSLKGRGPGKKIKTTFSNLFKFALQLSSLSILWVLVNQSDKLVLTNVMSLKDYSYYSLAISVVVVVSIVSGPMSQYLSPRLTKLYSENKKIEFAIVFEKTFLFLAIFLIPLCTFMFVDGKELIFIWTNNSDVAMRVQVYLPWLFAGASVAVFSNFAFLLRYSHGDLRSHTIVFSIFSVIIIFLNIFVAKEYQGVGSSIFYFVNTVFLFITWSLFTFCTYFSGFIRFFTIKIAPLFLFSSIIFISFPDYVIHDRILSLFFLVFKGGVGVVFCIAYIYFISKVPFHVKSSCPGYLKYKGYGIE